MTTHDFVPQNGMDVFGSDGEKVGKIDAIEQDYFVVSKGFFFPKDHYIPLSAVNSFDENAAYLNVTKDGALEQNWGEQPQVSYEQTDLGAPPAGLSQEDSGPVDEFGDGVTDVTDTNYGETSMDDPTLGESNFGDDAYTEVASRDSNLTDADTLEVREEDLQATTRDVDRGTVHVNKRVVEEQQSLDVPLTEEEVHVERRAVNRPVDSVDFEDTTIDVPVRGEEVEVAKTARVVEEIDIDKTARERIETVSDTVRHEEVDIDSSEVGGDVNRSRLSGDDDRSLLDKAKDAVDGDDNNRR